MKLIGLVGRAGVGKTTVAKHLCERYGFVRRAFGDPLKEMLLNAGMCSREELWGEKTPHSRYLLQKVGTEIFRKQVDKNFWVRRMALDVNQLINTGKRVVIDDIRFPEEANLVRSYRAHGLLVKIERGDYMDATAGMTHESESQVATIECNQIILAYSGEVDKIIWQMDEIMREKGGEANAL